MAQDAEGSQEAAGPAAGQLEGNQGEHRARLRTFGEPVGRTGGFPALLDRLETTGDQEDKSDHVRTVVAHSVLLEQSSH